MKLSDIPQEVINRYKLRDLATTDGSIHIKATKGMYGLPQACLLPYTLLMYTLLEKQLNERGCRQRKLIPGLWKHDWQPIQFTLVVDNFGVKYIGKKHALHLKNMRKSHCNMTNN